MRDPPLALMLLWRSCLKLRRKILGTIGIALFSALYAALIVFLLIRFTGLKIEWRGYVPALTYRKTAPNYAVVERHRAQQTHTRARLPPLPAPPPLHERQLVTEKSQMTTAFRPKNRTIGGEMVKKRSRNSRKSLSISNLRT